MKRTTPFLAIAIVAMSQKTFSQASIPVQAHVNEVWNQTKESIVIKKNGTIVAEVAPGEHMNTSITFDNFSGSPHNFSSTDKIELIGPNNTMHGALSLMKQSKSNEIDVKLSRQNTRGMRKGVFEDEDHHYNSGSMNTYNIRLKLRGKNIKNTDIEINKPR